MFTCAQCKARLVITASESDSLGHFSGRAANARLDESFLLLEEALGGRGGHEAGAESFIVLPNKPPSQHAGDFSTLTARVPLDQTLRAVTRVFEVATEQSQVDHPLCTDCAAEVHKELEAQLSDLQQEVASYEAALQRLEAEDLRPMDNAQFQQALKQAQGEAQHER